MKKINYGFVIAAIFLLSGCNKEVTGILSSGEYQIVKQTIENSIGWAKEKDFKLLYSIISNDSSYLEVQPNKRVVKGFDDFKKAEKFWKSPDFKAVKYEIRDLTINFSKSGNVAWWYCLLDDINEWQGKPASWENTRWTGVLEKQDGAWKIVQMHFSFADE
jgi:ketosteroid isomerase-like protein